MESLCEAVRDVLGEAWWNGLRAEGMVGSIAERVPFLVWDECLVMLMIPAGAGRLPPSTAAVGFAVGTPNFTICEYCQAVSAAPTCFFAQKARARSRNRENHCSTAQTPVGIGEKADADEKRDSGVKSGVDEDSGPWSVASEKVIQLPHFIEPRHGQR